MRRAAAAAAARIEAELDADRADQPVPPCHFAAEAEEAAVVAADGAVDGGAERQAAHPADVDQVARADDADARAVAGEADLLEADPCVRRRNRQRRRRVLLGEREPRRCDERDDREDAAGAAAECRHHESPAYRFAGVGFASSQSTAA